MKIVRTIARLLLGALFVFAGVAGFLMAPPPAPGAAGEFSAVVYATHFMNFVSAAQLVLGVLLLVNRYVPIALIILAAFLYNSFAFHATMAPAGLAAPIIVGGLWYLVALQYRASFAPLFVAKPGADGETTEARTTEAG